MLRPARRRRPDADGGGSGERSAGGDEVEVDCAGPGCLAEEPQRYLASRRGSGLIAQKGHLQVGGDVPGEHGVLGTSGEGSADLGELLLGAGGVGRVGVGPGGNGDVGADGAKAYVVEANGRILVDVERGGVGGGVDDADLGEGLGAGDAAATRERCGQEGEGGKAGRCGWRDGGGSKQHGPGGGAGKPGYFSHIGRRNGG